MDSPYIRFIFEKLVEFGANKDILYEAKPHVGTDILREVIVNIRKHLIASGVKVMFNTELIDFNDTSAKLLYNNNTGNFNPFCFYLFFVYSLFTFHRCQIVKSRCFFLLFLFIFDNHL